MTSNIPEELLDVFTDGGQPGTKRPKDKVLCMNKFSLLLDIFAVEFKRGVKYDLPLGIFENV